ncbi:elongation factor P maturation arginine rhamnosyltransferase EarP [Hydrogenophaga sp. MI9]|uniref:elongation factor P maturation arginine rhamnosyltransferase EarP n=1 Tax=Hydrogenophaga sp. MI9 TaxID=3453719 RepID=UPI003EE8C0DB
MQWDIFCRVIDNLGDTGVCWRLCADLARRGEPVRLWIDVPDDLAWMAPGALESRWPGVQVFRWTAPLPAGLVASLPPAEVWIEAFGCDPAPEFLDDLARRLTEGATPPVWINLEYMSAEAWVERSHRLPSPVMTGPLRGLTKWFLFPGFTPATGGLLREADLPARQADFDAPAWLDAQGLPSGERPRASLFCYEPPALAAVLRQAGRDTASDWLVTAGRASDAVAAVQKDGQDMGAPDLHAVPRLTQHGYDHLLWSCDLNFVRGEDSLVRALWAGRPFVWHIYPQHDNAHHAKLEAFLDWLEAPASLRDFHRAWNGLTRPERVWPGWETVRGWSGCALAARQRLLAQADLTSQLLGFVAEKR